MVKSSIDTTGSSSPTHVSLSKNKVNDIQRPMHDNDNFLRENNELNTNKAKVVNVKATPKSYLRWSVVSSLCCIFSWCR